MLAKPGLRQFRPTFFLSRSLRDEQGDGDGHLSLPVIGVTTGLVAITAGVAVGSALAPKLVVVGAAAAIAAGTCLAFPRVGYLALTAFFLVQFSPLYEQYGRLLPFATASDLIAGLVLIGFVIQVTRGRGDWTHLRGAGFTTVLLTAFVCWQVTSVLWTPASVSVSLGFVRVMTEGLILFGLTLLLTRTPEWARIAAATYAVVGAAMALYVILTFAGAHGFSAANPFQAFRGGLPTSFNPNEHAVELSLVPFFALYAASLTQARIRVLVGAVAVPTTGLALLILASREVFLDLAVAAVAMVLVSRSGKTAVATAVSVTVAAAGYMVASLANLVPSYFAGRFSQAGAFGVGNAGGRLPTWIVGSHVFAANPLTGAGAVGMETYIPQYHVNFTRVVAAHSDYVRTLADSGLIGGFLMVGFLAAFVTPFIRAASAPLAAIAAILLTEMFAGDSMLWHFTWVAAGIAYCAAVTTQPERAPHGRTGNVYSTAPEQQPSSLQPRLAGIS